MKLDFALELQAYLDGELPAGERRALEQRLAADANAKALLSELRVARTALAAGETPRPVPASREFYWSQIQREIDRQAAANRHEAPHSRAPWWRRFLVPAMSVATLALGLTLTLDRLPTGGNAMLVDTSLSDSGALTYRDAKEGITLVWLSYPADTALNELDEGDNPE